MSLERFRRARMIVLTPRSTAFEAARAMAEGRIGSVLVGRDQRVAGIVTDRDLALDVVAGDLDPRATQVRDVMSDEVACCDIGASIEDVLRAMQQHGCRRVPLTEGGRPVGIVTLDDLVLEGLIDIETVRSIVRAQFEFASGPKDEAEAATAEEAATMSPARTRALMRRRARAENTYGRLMRSAERHTGLDRRRAEQAVLVVLGMICRRLMPQEARHLIAQLPSKLQVELERSLSGPDRGVTTGAIEEALGRMLGSDAAMASDVLYAICDAIADAVSAGEIEAVRGQLPAAMKELFPPPFRRAG